MPSQKYPPPPATDPARRLGRNAAGRGPEGGTGLTPALDSVPHSTPVGSTIPPWPCHPPPVCPQGAPTCCPHPEPTRAPAQCPRRPELTSSLAGTLTALGCQAGEASILSHQHHQHRGHSDAASPTVQALGMDRSPPPGPRVALDTSRPSQVGHVWVPSPGNGLSPGGPPGVLMGNPGAVGPP